MTIAASSAMHAVEGGDALLAAIEQLREGEFQGRWEACKRLAQLGDRVVAYLPQLVNGTEEDEELRWFIARLLGTFRQPAALQLLLRLLGDGESEDVLAEATQSLAGFGQAAIAPLRSLLAQPEQRVLAVRALAFIRLPDSVPPILSVVLDENVAVREAALESLGAFSPEPAIVDAVVQALRDPASRVRRTALLGIGAAIAAEPERGWLPLLKPLMWDLDPQVAAAAVRAIARLDSEDAGVVLGDLLFDAYSPLVVQLEGVRGLGYLKLASGITQLRRRLFSTERIAADVQLECIRVLGRVDEPSLQSQAAAVLHDWIAEGGSAQLPISTQQAIAHSLGQLAQPNSLKPLLQLLGSEQASIRFHVTAAMTRLATDNLLGQLLRLNQDRTYLSDPQTLGLAAAIAELESVQEPES